MSEKKQTLSERRNFNLKFAFEEGTTEYVPFSCPTSDEDSSPPTPPWAKRRRVEEESEEDEASEAVVEDEAGEQEAVEEEAVEESGEASEEEGGTDSSDEDITSLTFLWPEVREKWFTYTPLSVLGLDSCEDLRKIQNYYFPASQPRNHQEFVYLALVRKACEKRLKQLGCQCEMCL